MRKSELISRIEELENTNKELLRKLGLKTIEVLELKKVYTAQINSLYDRLDNLSKYLSDEISSHPENEKSQTEDDINKKLS